MLNEIFREYDIRGIFGDDLNETNVKALGKELGAYFYERGVKTLSIGRDARTHGETIFGWLVSGLNLSQIELFDIGLLPTPVGYFSVFCGKFDANIMITGSHNPKEYNGFKITIFKDSFFGVALSEFGKKVIRSANKKLFIPDNFSITKFDIKTPYLRFLEREFSGLRGLDLNFAIDCANGAMGAVVPQLCDVLGLKAQILFSEPDGNFPNHHPDPSIKENLKDIQTAVENGAKIGFAFDGDGDRIAVITPKHNIKGDELAYLYSLKMERPIILGEVKCSQVMYDEINKRGQAIMGKTGHSNIKKTIKENPQIALGAEVSGHIYFKERYFGFDDGLYAMLRLLELVQNGVDLDAELERLPRVFSTDEIKVQTSDELKFRVVDILKNRLKRREKALPKINEIIEIDGVRVHFDGGWALVRASNTTPVIVTRFEANTTEFRDELQAKFGAILDEILADPDAAQNAILEELQNSEQDDFKKRNFGATQEQNKSEMSGKFGGEFKDKTRRKFERKDFKDEKNRDKDDKKSKFTKDKFEIKTDKFGERKKKFDEKDDFKKRAFNDKSRNFSKKSETKFGDKDGANVDTNDTKSRSKFDAKKFSKSGDKPRFDKKDGFKFDKKTNKKFGEKSSSKFNSKFKANDKDGTNLGANDEKSKGERAKFGAKNGAKFGLKSGSKFSTNSKSKFGKKDEKGGAKFGEKSSNRKSNFGAKGGANAKNSSNFKSKSRSNFKSPSAKGVNFSSSSRKKGAK